MKCYAVVDFKNICNFC